MKSRISRSEAGAAGKAPCAYFNGTLLRKNLTRFWPLWAAYTVAWLIILPLIQFVELFGDSARHSSAEQLAATATGEVLSASATGGLIMGAAFGCLFAMALFSYLCSARSVGMMHSFPIRREGLFLTNYLSGAVVFLSADLLTFLLTAAVQGAAGMLSWGNLGIWLACSAGMMLFFYSFAVFCTMFTGQILAVPVFYAILNVLAGGLDNLIQSFASGFLYGYNGGGTPAWIKWLTPAWNLQNRLQVHSTWNELGQYADHYRMTGLSTVPVYAAAGIVFAVLALLVYRARRSETAGDIVTVRWARELFRFGVAVCCALSLGQGLYYLAWKEFCPHGTNSMPAMLACLVLLGLVGYFAAEMLLQKSFRVLKKSWRGAAVLVAALIALGVCTSLDVTGVQGRVPEADAVQMLSFSIGGENRCSGATKDAALIKRFRTVHQALIQEKELQQSRSRETYYSGQKPDSRGPYETAYLSLDYTLKNGSTVSRSYEINYIKKDLANSDCSIAILADLVASPKVQRISILGKADLTHLTSGEMEYVSGNGYHDYVTFDAAAAQAIYTALQQDIDAGHFGVNQFDEDKWEKEAYVNGLTLYYSTGEDSMDSCSFSFSKNCTALTAALQKAGVMDAQHPLTTYAQEDSDTEQHQPAADATETAAGSAAETIIGGADGPTEIYVAD